MGDLVSLGHGSPAASLHGRTGEGTVWGVATTCPDKQTSYCGFHQGGLSGARLPAGGVEEILHCEIPARNNDRDKRGPPEQSGRLGEE